MKKIAKIFIFILFAITIAVGIYFFPQAKRDMDLGIMGLFLVWVYIMFGITILLILTLPLFSTNPQSFKKMALSIGFLAVVLGIAYIFGTDVPSAGIIALNKPISGTTLKLIDVYVIGTYIMLGLTLLALVFSTVLNSIRNR
jgi:hypothetical protein